MANAFGRHDTGAADVDEARPTLKAPDLRRWSAGSAGPVWKGIGAAPRKLVKFIERRGNDNTAGSTKKCAGVGVVGQSSVP